MHETNVLFLSFLSSLSSPLSLSLSLSFFLSSLFLFPGTVKWFNEAKGFGFIMPLEGPDIYFKGNDVGGHVPLKTDDQVSYEIVKAKDAEAKQWAVNITKVPFLKRLEFYDL